MSKEQKDAQPPTLPPASEQSSNHISHVLDFGHGEGGNMQPKVERDQEPAFKKRKLDSQSGISSNNDQFSTGPDLVSIECETSKNLSLECQASKDVDSDSQISMIIEDQNHRPESPVDIEKTMASSHNAQVFEIIDDLGSDREEYYESEDDYDDDDIDALLDECLDKPRNTSASEADVDGDVDTETDPSAPEEKEKVVLIEKGHDPFEVLPEGWVTVTHNSGIPVYLHKQSRVCTLAKPYFLGPGSARKHDIPVSAIPCLQYRKELEKESMKQDQNGSEDYSQDNCTPNLVNGTSPPNLPSIPVKVMSVEEKKKETILDHKQLHEYCQKLFQFKTITVRRFKTWKDRRKHQKQKKKEARPSMPESAKLITCPLNIAKDAGGGAPSRPKAYVLSPHGKSYVCILQEYVQHTMKLQPKYIFQEIDNSANPHRATVVIDDIEYGSGLAKSKKQAKLNAAKETLNVLIPEMKKFTEEKESTSESLLSDVSFYDEIRIEDPRVYELSQKTGHPSPYEILLVCLNRNQGMGDTKVKMTMNTLKHQKVEFTMTVGKHTATVPCKNKREGKQLAAQSILKLFHPYVYNWGSILRLYSVSDKQVMEEKKEDDEIEETFGFIGPQLLIHAASQTEVIGNVTFHKATQFPDVVYDPENRLQKSNSLLRTNPNNGCQKCQDKPLGKSEPAIHKATQFPECTYSSMDDNWESSRPPRSQSNTKSSSPVIQHNPLPFKLNPAGYAMNPYASHMFRYPVSVGMTRYPSRLPCMLATTPSSQGYAPYQPRPSPDIQVQQKEKDIQVMGAGKPNVVEASCYAREVTSPESSQAVPYQQQTWSGSGQDAHLHYPWPHGTSSIPITPSTVGLTVPYTAQPLSAAAVTAAPSENLYHLPADAASFSQYQLAAPRSQNVTSGSRHSRQK